MLEFLFVYGCNCGARSSLEQMKMIKHQLIAAFDNGDIKVWDLRTKLLVNSFNWYVNKGPSAANFGSTKIQDIAIYGNCIAIIPMGVNHVEFWNINKKSFICSVSLEFQPLKVQFDKDYAAVSLSNGTVKLWKANAMPPQSEVD